MKFDKFVFCTSVCLTVALLSSSPSGAEQLGSRASSKASLGLGVNNTALNLRAACEPRKDLKQFERLEGELSQSFATTKGLLEFASTQLDDAESLETVPDRRTKTIKTALKVNNKFVAQSNQQKVQLKNAKLLLIKLRKCRVKVNPLLQEFVAEAKFQQQQATNLRKQLKAVRYRQASASNQAVN